MNAPLTPVRNPAAEPMISALPSGSAGLLRFITCGSVDDGKSTLIGRLLYELGQVPDDQLDALREASSRFGTQGAETDYALLLDGLAAEREQGITIDVAYRYFHSAQRSFIVADTPGHEQYTRNMATGASTADLAIILVDARKGILAQTRRHATIVTLLGIREIVLAVNKMDLIDYNQAEFEKIVTNFRKDVNGLGVEGVDALKITAIPLAARSGDNVTSASARMPWYQGPSLSRHLDEVRPASYVSNRFHFSVGWVNRPNADFRGFSGQVLSGRVAPGDEVIIQPGGQRARIARIVTFDGDLDAATAPQAVTLVLDREIDVSRGIVISSAADHAGDTARVTRNLTARVLALSPAGLSPDRSYVLKSLSRETGAHITRFGTAIDFATLERTSVTTLSVNQISEAELSLDRPSLLDDYVRHRALGAFILIDRLSHETVAMGMISHISTAVSEAPPPKGMVAQFKTWLSADITPIALPRLMAHYRIWLPVSALLTAVIVFVVTRNLLLSLGAGGIDLILRPALQWALWHRKPRVRPVPSEDIHIDGGGI